MESEDTTAANVAETPAPVPVLGLEEPPTPPGMIRISAGKHYAWLAVVCTLLLQGGGQFYNRQWQKGLVILGVNLFIVVMTTLLQKPLGANTSSTIWLVAAGILGIVGIGDGRAIARRLARGDAVSRWQWF